MKLASLFSGGKDSTYAMYKALKEGHEIACLISVISQNPESYMFHTPNIHLTELQAQALELPLISINTKGEKEEELKDLERAIRKAVSLYRIEGIVSGAVASEYQYSRIKSICIKLKLKSITPLWRMEQFALLREIVKEGFHCVIVGVFAEPFTEQWLGREINKQTIKELELIHQKFRINPAGEGGEFESFVYDCPLFKKKIRILEYKKNYANYAGVLNIEKAELGLAD
ncbi:TIGR00289 family protein [archaeon]|nr:TIGR00289 family protein [archaeon]